MAAYVPSAGSSSTALCCAAQNVTARGARGASELTSPAPYAADRDRGDHDECTDYDARDGTATKAA